MNSDIYAHAIPIFATALIAAAAIFLAMKLHFFSWKREGDFARLNVTDVLGAFFTFVTIQLVVSPALMMGYFYLIEKKSLYQMQHLDYVTESWLGIINNLLLFIGFTMYCFFKRDKVKTFFGRKLRFSDFLIGVLTWLISTPIATILGEIVDALLSFVREKPVDQTAVLHLKHTAMYPTLFVATAIMVVTLVPLMEELLFRGFLQTWLRQKTGPRVAIIAASIVFALFHFSVNQSYDNFLILTILFTVSCFMGFVYERQKSLLAPIGLHATFNAVTTFSIFFSSDPLL